MSTCVIIMTCMLLFDVYVGKLMCQVETYDHHGPVLISYSELFSGELGGRRGGARGGRGTRG